MRLAGPLAAAAILVLAARAPAQPSQVGSWASPLGWPIVASHAALLANGKVLLWNDQTGTVPRIFDPSNNSITTAAAINTNVAGSTQVLLDDGDVLVLGGRDAQGAGIAAAHRYDATAATWTSLPDLTQARAAASAILLGDARVLVLSGEIVPGQPADRPELAFAGSPWVQLSDALLALPPAPWIFPLTNRQVIETGPEVVTRQLDPRDQGSWRYVASMRFGSREAGSAVLVPNAPDRVFVTGGHDPATATCEILDLPLTSSWEYTGSMARARRHHNATILADGTVLVTGGTLSGDALEHAVYEAERYQPATGAWTTLAPMTVPRRRGSVALLLADGRVLCAGGGDGTPGSEPHADAEIFSPPHLFLGTRPAVSNPPGGVVYGGTFTVDSPQAADIAQVWFVRSGAVTRSFNSDQRALQLSFTTAPGRITATAPASGDVAPPGMYLLFLVDDAGVPSTGSLVRLQEGVPQPVAPDITSTPPTTGTVNVPYNYEAAASGTTPMTWSLVTAPSWLSVSPSTGFVAGVPTGTGTFNVTLRATNAGGSDNQSWSIQVSSGSAGTRTVIPLGATWKYFKGNANPGSTWPNLGFNDAAWLSGPSGFGFGDNDDATVLSDMVNNYSTVFTRRTFDLYNLATVTQIALLYQYDDGLAVYLNGTRIFGANAPATITNTSLATSSHEASSTLIRRNFTDGTTLGLLRSGQNVLAAVGLNSSLSSSDLTLKVTLEVTGGSDTQTDAGGGPGGGGAGAAHPNPFAASTRVAFSMVRPGDAMLEVFDVAGRRVRRVRARALPAGDHVLMWDGMDAAGRPAPPGIYFYRLDAPGLERRGKLTRAR